MNTYLIKLLLFIKDNTKDSVCLSVLSIFIEIINNYILNFNIEDIYIKAAYGTYFDIIVQQKNKTQIDLIKELAFKNLIEK